ncbi:MAG: hypothetical protein RSP_08340 [Rhodanobacter sp.]
MDAHVPQCAGVVRLSQPLPGRRWPAWLPALAGLLLLACLPWWLGLPLLLACAWALCWRAGRFAAPLRRGLRWALAGWLLAIWRGFGADAQALLWSLLAALAGYSLLVLLESWLGRGRSGEALHAPTSEWSELAQAPIGPTDTLIELRPPSWRALAQGAADPLGGRLHWRQGAAQLAEGRAIAGVEPCCDFSDDGRWLALPMADHGGLWLLDRRRDRCHRLRGWQLAGWHGGQPWLSRGDERMPMPLAHALGRDEDD